MPSLRSKGPKLPIAPDHDLRAKNKPSLSKLTIELGDHVQFVGINSEKFRHLNGGIGVVVHAKNPETGRWGIVPLDEDARQHLLEPLAFKEGNLTRIDVDSIGRRGSTMEDETRIEAQLYRQALGVLMDWADPLCPCCGFPDRCERKNGYMEIVDFREPILDALPPVVPDQTRGSIADILTDPLSEVLNLDPGRQREQFLRHLATHIGVVCDDQMERGRDHRRGAKNPKAWADLRQLVDKNFSGQKQFRDSLNKLGWHGYECCVWVLADFPQYFRIQVGEVRGEVKGIGMSEIWAQVRSNGRGPPADHEQGNGPVKGSGPAKKKGGGKKGKQHLKWRAYRWGELVDEREGSIRVQLTETALRELEERVFPRLVSVFTSSKLEWIDVNVKGGSSVAGPLRDRLAKIERRAEERGAAKNGVAVRVKLHCRDLLAHCRRDCRNEDHTTRTWSAETLAAASNTKRRELAPVFDSIVACLSEHFSAATTKSPLISLQICSSEPAVSLSGALDGASREIKGSPADFLFSDLVSNPSLAKLSESPVGAQLRFLSLDLAHCVDDATLACFLQNCPNLQELYVPGPYDFGALAHDAMQQMCDQLLGARRDEMGTEEFARIAALRIADKQKMAAPALIEGCIKHAPAALDAQQILFKLDQQHADEGPAPEAIGGGGRPPGASVSKGAKKNAREKRKREERQREAVVLEVFRDHVERRHGVGETLFEQSNLYIRLAPTFVHVPRLAKLGLANQPCLHVDEEWWTRRSWLSVTDPEFGQVEFEIGEEESDADGLDFF